MNNIVTLLSYGAGGYLPGIVLFFVIWLIARRSSAMPLFPADSISFILPIIVWSVFYECGWTLNKNSNCNGCGLMILGWIWSVCVVARLLIPRFTHKLRFRLAAINTGTICTIAAILLALFY